MNGGSFDNSYEVHGQLNGHHPANFNHDRVGHVYATSEEEDDGHHAWHDFGISPVNSLDHMTFEDDSSNMVIPGLMDDSLLVGGSSSHLSERSILRSEYERMFWQPSASTSQVIVAAGAAFDGQLNHFIDRPLPLTPECRHSINQPVIPRYMH